MKIISEKAINQIKALGLKFKGFDGGFRVSGFFELKIKHEEVYNILQNDGVTGWVAPSTNYIEFVYLLV